MRIENYLLSGLSADAREQVRARAQAVSLRVKEPLNKAGLVPSYVYFITSGMASMVTPMHEGDSAEVGMMGREGLVSALNLMGTVPTISDTIVQVEGTALRVPLAAMRELFQGSEEIRTRILAYLQVQSLGLAQIAGCHRLHSAEERLSRWLLMARDRADSDTLGLTQEFLAQMLGARRTTVTLVAGTLQRSGLIHYQRGQVQILDREGLEGAACECYRVLRKLQGPPPAF